MKLYALIHPNLYQFQGHPCFRLNQCIKSPTPPESLHYNHPQNVLVNAEQHTLRTHTRLKSFAQTYTAIQGSNSERIGAAATHYRGGSCFDWARSEAGRKLDPLHWSRLSLSSLFSLSVSFSFCLDNHSSGTLQTNDLDSYWQHCHITPIISLNSPIRGQKPWKCLLHEGLKATDLSVTYSR